MADHPPTWIKLHRIYGYRPPNPFHLNQNSPGEFLRRSIAKIYIGSAPHCQMERDMLPGRLLTRCTCAHSICPLNEDGSKVGFIDQVLTQAHRTLGSAATPQIAQSDNPHENILFAFVQQLEKYLKTLNQRQHFQNNGIAARKQIEAALDAFETNECYNFDFCLWPLWGFLFTLVRVAYDLGFANKHSIRFDCIDGVKTFSQLVEHPISIVDDGELQAVDRTCVVCLEPYHTRQEAYNRRNFVHDLPFAFYNDDEKPVGESQLSRRDNPPDLPYRTRCGHILGLSCFAKLVDDKLHVAKDGFALCPMCRTPLLRRDWGKQFRLFNMGHQVGFTVPDECRSVIRVSSVGKARGNS